MLIAKLRRIPEDHRICFQLEPELSAVRHARSLIRDPLKRWGLEDLIDSSELLVSELVTNAIKYANGEVMLRLILEPDTLVCEVHDSSPALPRVLQVDKDAENGRGLHVVSQMASRWGVRRTAGGKVVWCEQLVPEEVTEAMLAAMGAEAPVAEAEVAARRGLDCSRDGTVAGRSEPGTRSESEFLDFLPLNFPNGSWFHVRPSAYSTVTLFARLRGLSMSRPSFAAAW